MKSIVRGEIALATIDEIFFRENSQKNACQAPFPTKPFHINKKRIAKTGFKTAIIEIEGLIAVHFPKSWEVTVNSFTINILNATYLE